MDAIEPAANHPTPTPAATTEVVWLVEATLAPDAAEARVPFRPEHLAGISRRLSDGTYVEAGAFSDLSMSVLLVRAASEAEAIAIVGDDIYLRNGIWVELRARPFGRIVIPADGRS